jgi:hypothetical protein
MEKENATAECASAILLVGSAAYRPLLEQTTRKATVNLMFRWAFGFTTSQNPIGLHGLLRGLLYFTFFTAIAFWVSKSQPIFPIYKHIT